MKNCTTKLAQAILAAVPNTPDNAALRTLVKAVEEECRPFNFPDEDRPILFDALEVINQLVIKK